MSLSLDKTIIHSISTGLLLSGAIFLNGCTPTSHTPGSSSSAPASSANSWFEREVTNEGTAGVWETREYDDGVHYEGQFVDGKRHGRGVQTWPDGARYEGEFQNDRRQGRGVFTWPSNARYEGEFVDGKRHGQGVYTWPNGARYQGRYVDGQRDGPGTFHYPPDAQGKNIQEKQVWKNDQLISNTPVIHPKPEPVPEAIPNPSLSDRRQPPAFLQKENKLSPPKDGPAVPSSNSPGQSSGAITASSPANHPPIQKPAVTTAALTPPDALSADNRKPKLWSDPETGISLAFVSGGCFNMGNDRGEKNEKPVHEVCVDSFWMGVYEITQKQWRQVMKWLPEQTIEADHLPVGNVSWENVQQFIQTINKRSGVQFRLPTEAQWEYACTGGGIHKSYCGDGSVHNLGWVEENAKNQPHPPGERAANRFGLYDMTGNLWEWVSDWYDREYYRYSQKQNPDGPTAGSSRVFRGSGWLSKGEFARATMRQDMDPNRSYPLLGFRLSTSRVLGQ
ncbi:MAG: SUMF1/EgtB/PvdO family nonheme iron enzyme [Magnetococcales bacterium]|nr:SUMF1/EgtB/PvdO family nonheme iron enzyme [Magnetococcales bacterium]